MAKKTQQQIKEEIQNVLETSDKAVAEAVLYVFENQTHIEQLRGVTTDNNGIGFTGADSEFLSSIAKQYKEKSKLSEKQINCIKKKVKKYWKQLSNDERFFSSDWDELQKSVSQKKKITCKKCGQENLEWYNYPDGGYDLYDSYEEKVHDCPVVRKYKEEKLEKEKERLDKQKAKEVTCRRCNCGGLFWESKTFKKGSWTLRSIKTGYQHKCKTGYDTWWY